MSIWSYIQGKRYGEEANQLEKEAMRDPFLQDAIDGYDRVNDRPFYHLKKLEKQLSKRTEKRLHSLQAWGIAAAVLLIICLTVFFFSNSKVNFLRETTFLKNHTDDVISKYTKDSVYTENNVPVVKQIPVDRVVQPIQQVQPKQREEIKKSKENQDVVQDDSFDEPAQYTLSSDEIEALLSTYNNPEEIKTPPPADNPDQTSKPAKGNKAYDDYIEQNRQQLASANCANQHGKVILLFHVNNQGRPVDIAVLRSLCPEADREAARLLRNGPGWTVGDPVARLEVDF